MHSVWFEGEVRNLEADEGGLRNRRNQEYQCPWEGQSFQEQRKMTDGHALGNSTATRKT